MSPVRCARPAHGFTLVETLVALALLSVALTAVGRLMIMSRLGLEESLARSRVHGHAASLVATLQSLPAGHSWLADGVTLEPAAVRGLRLRGDVRPWPGVDQVRLVEVNATWGGGARRRSSLRLGALRRPGGRP